MLGNTWCVCLCAHGYVVYAYVYLCTQVARILGHMNKGQKLTSGVFLSSSLSRLLRQGFSMNMELTCTNTRPSGSRNSPISNPSPRTGATGTHYHAQLLCGFWGFELRSSCFLQQALHPLSGFPVSL